MALRCNLDERGARMRRVAGIMALLGAALLGGLALWSQVWWVWVIAGFAAAGGVFALFEARKKWCAIRALTGSPGDGR